jgi:hypothetical protein
MSKIRADLITQMHAMENKMSSCMSVIREVIQTQIGDALAKQNSKRGLISNRRMSTPWLNNYPEPAGEYRSHTAKI